MDTKELLKIMQEILNDKTLMQEVVVKSIPIYKHVKVKRKKK